MTCHLEDPSTLFKVLCLQDLGVQPDVLVNAKLLGVRLEVSMDHRAGDVFSWFHAETLGHHGEVRVLVGAEQVIGLQSGVEALRGPDATDGGRSIEDSQRGLRVLDMILLGCT